MWASIWLGVTVLVVIWDILFLNGPARRDVLAGSINTLTVCLLTVVMTLVLGWAGALILYFSRRTKSGALSFSITFVFNCIRSVPQIVGILLAYVLIATLRQSGVIGSDFVAFICMALGISLFVFLEVVDLLGERIEHFEKSDFVSAMRVCGIPDWRIINYNIFWNNSKTHIFNKLISIFGAAVFLQCSVDFIISVGLSQDVSGVSLPTSLGSLLARIDSKQDILAIGYSLTHPNYLPNLFFQHLQGVTIAFLIVWTLFSVHNVSNAFARRRHLS